MKTDYIKPVTLLCKVCNKKTPHWPGGTPLGTLAMYCQCCNNPDR